MITRFEVQTSNGNRWENVWTEDDKPLTFATTREAFIAIGEHIEDCTAAAVWGALKDAPAFSDFRVRSVLMEPGYQRRLSLVYGRVYESMQGFTDEQRKIMSRTITKGMAAGQSPRVIARDLSEQTGQIRWRALRISATEINTAFNRATLEETTALNDDVFADSAYEVADMHISALLATTRPDHGRRHGTIATPEEQNYWWDNVAVGSRVNCHCSTVDVLVNKKTRDPMQSRLVAKAKEQRKQYFGGD